MSKLKILCLLIGAALCACQDRPQRPACPAGQQCFEFGLDLEPATLDPQKASLVSDIWVIGDLMMGLTTAAADGHPIPGGATSWETSADGLVWTFHLRHEARWSDGAPITADDYVFGLQRLVDPNTAAPYAYLGYVIRGGQAVNESRAPLASLGLKAVDPYTVQLRLEHPAPYLLELAKNPSFYPAPRHLLRRYGEAWVAPGRQASNGPYKLVSWRLGDRIQLVKNPQFYDAGHVCFDRIDYVSTPDGISTERRIARGELDAANSFQSNRLARLHQALPGYAHTAPQLSTLYLSFNTRGVAALRNPRVRRALSESIDRRFITDKLTRAGQLPAYSFVPPAIADYPPGAATDWARESLVQRQIEAKALLAQAGFSPARPLRIEFKTTTTSESLLVAQAIQADWRAIGVDAHLVQNDGPVAFAAYRDRDFQVGMMSWSADFNDAATFLTLLKSETGQQNYGDYRNAAYDALLAVADHEPAAARRAKTLKAAEQMMLDEDALAPLFFMVSRALVNPRIAGWVDNPENLHRSRWLCAPAER